MDKAAVQEMLRQDLVNAIRSAQFEGESEIAARLIAIASVIPPAGAVSPWLLAEQNKAPLGKRMSRLWARSVGRIKRPQGPEHTAERPIDPAPRQ